jgi:hypothetical protein
MEDPNSRQVGGSHYAGSNGPQHWDIMETYAVPYLEGNATKYLSRWHRKNGVQDLEKALHYVEKLINTVDNGFRDGSSTSINRGRRVVPSATILQFATEQGMGTASTQVVTRLLTWKSVDELQVARLMIKLIIKTLTVES